MSATDRLIPGSVPLAAWRSIVEGRGPVGLDPSCRTEVEAGAATVARILAEGRTAYGINTGFGKLAQTRIAADKLEQLQANLVLSHAAGTGPLLDDATVRLILALKVASLARGRSGVRWDVIEALLALLDKRVMPCIPSQGSVGASGDLAPLAHMTAALMGVGEVRIDGRRWPAVDGLRRAGLTPLTLAPKEGLALLNGTQVSTALALRALFAAENALAAGVVVGALSVEAARGSRVPFDARIHAVRGQPGQRDIAAAFRALLGDTSAIGQSHVDCDRVQDPYSLRCQPQVLGACLDHLRFAAGVLEREANAVSDNPLVFPDSGDVLSGGNFHAEPVAMAADVLALVIAETGSLAERRIALLIDPAFSGLPPFLATDPGVHSGFMIAQVTAAALTSENKQKAYPACVDSLPTSANQEDHVSMATHGARRSLEMADNAAAILGIEWLAAAQGIDFLRPLTTSPALEEVHRRLRDSVAFYDADRYIAPDIEAAKALVGDGVFLPHVPGLLPGTPVAETGT